MDMLYDRGLAPLPKSEAQEKLIRHYHEQYQWPLAAAILLLLAEMFLPERRDGRTGKVHQAPKPEPSPRRLRLLIAVLFCRLAASASPADALRDYQSGNYTNALAEFTKLAEVRTNDLRLVFNAGDGGVSRDKF